MKTKVLLVDDARFMRMILKEILIKLDCEVVGEASNGEEAVKMYREIRPDLVTMDIVMPGMGGVEAVKKIKAINPNANVLMVSAMGQQALVSESLEAGASDFIVKPFVSEDVIDKIQKIIGSSENLEKSTK